MSDRLIVERATARARTPEGIRVASSLWRSFGQPGNDLRSRAEQIDAPTLIVRGTRDKTLPLKYGRAAQKAISNSRLVTLETGHVAFSSDPAGFLAEARPFIESVSGPRSDRSSS